MALTKAEIAEALFDQLGLNKREARELVDLFFEELRASLSTRRTGQAVGLRQLRSARQESATGPQSKNRRRNSDQRPPRRDIPTRTETEGSSRGICWNQAITANCPAIPGKRYFTIGEVSELCGVKPHVLRYWEQEFPQLKPVKRRGNRRYYQRQDVLVIRQIRSLLYEQGFTIGGARNRLQGDEARDDVTQTQQIVRQMRGSSKKSLRILRRS